jgi:hypothetical protein
MSSAASNLVNKVWNYCNLLRDDGVSYGDYVEQLTYLLFLKMDYERTRPPYNKKSTIPEDYNWASLIEMDGLPLDRHYRNMAIPHYGGRHANAAFHNPKLQRQIEIFSDHRRSEDWATPFLQNGYRLGIMASSDNHAGNAGYGIRRREVVSGEEGEVFSKRSPAEQGTARLPPMPRT